MNKNVKALIYSIMAVSLVVCSFIGFRRVEVEENYKEAQVMVRYSDVLRIMRDTDSTLEEVLLELQAEGANTLLVRENIVASASETDLNTYKGLDKAKLYEGYILKFYYEDVADIKPDARYIVTESKDVAMNIYNSYNTKGYELEYIEADGTYFIDIDEHSSKITSVGVGFDVESLNKAAALGYTISPQLKSIKEPTHESIEYIKNQIDAINNIGDIYFSDSKIPAVEDSSMHELIQEYGLGFIEFTSNKQEGFNTLAKLTSDLGKEYNVIRLHTIGDRQTEDFTVSELMERYELALKERNIRAFLFKMPETDNIEEDMNYLKASTKEFTNILEEDGYTVVNDVSPYNLPLISGVLAILAGLASIMITVLLISELGYSKLGYIIGAVGIIGYVGLIKLNPNLASQAMALFGSIMFPTYAMLKGLSEKPRTTKEAIAVFLKICLISFGGVLTIIGTLSRTNFAMGLDVFAGVKVATFAPILIIVVLLIYIKHKFDFKYYKSILDRKITYGELVIFALLAGILVIYISRTGNSGTASTLEREFRQLLDNLLGVRPRTKEFLIAYPILLCLLRYGYKEIYIPFVMLAAIGPISLVNTYAHIHTPILISILRSIYGIAFGILIGLVLIGILNLLGRKMKKWQTQIK